jgi:AraC family transcriptional regulator
MILRRFPGTQAREHAAQGRGRDFSFFGRENVIVYATSRDIAYAEHTAPLSVKTTLEGSEVYEVDGVPIAVDENSYLVLNNDQPYASYISSDEEVVSFCVFFRDGLEQEVSAPLDCSQEMLLERPSEELISPPPFFQSRCRHDPALSLMIRQLHADIASGMTSQLWLDERCNDLMEALLLADRQLFREAERLPLMKRATRVEVYRRLCRAKDYIESCYYEPITLRLLAGVACLSPHHFLRLFKAAFRVTPHQYLTDVRLRHARRLIEEKGYPVARACGLAGFESHSSFSRLFKRRFRCSPRAVRPTGQG